MRGGRNCQLRLDVRIDLDVPRIALGTGGTLVALWASRVQRTAVNIDVNKGRGKMGP